MAETASSDPSRTITRGSVRDGWVYFIRAGRGVGQARIKIGWAKTDPRKRLKELQIGSHVELELLGAVPGTRRDEAALHAKYELSRTHGEWFHLEHGMLNDLKRPDAAFLHPHIERWREAA